MVPSGLKCWVPGISSPQGVWGQGRQGDMRERRSFCSFQKPPDLWREVQCSRVAQTSVISLHYPRLLLSLFLLLLIFPPPPEMNTLCCLSGQSSSLLPTRVASRAGPKPNTWNYPQGRVVGAGCVSGLANECLEAALPASPDPQSGWS